MPDRRYLQPYRRAIECHGPTFEATLWRSPEAQLARFQAMLKLACFADAVIVDAGCGRGDFAEFLLESDVRFARYVGLDALPEMIEAAQQRDSPRCHFEVADVLRNPQAIAAHSPDYVCMSGTLNTMDEEAARKLVESSFRAARQSIVFNFLSDRPHDPIMDEEVGPARRFDTLEWVKWSLTLSSRVTFTQDYLDGRDATIMISHAPPD